MAVEKDAGSDSGADRNIDQMAAAFAYATSCCCKRCSVGIVFDCDAKSEFGLKRGDQVATLPSGQGANYADHSGRWIKRTRACDANPFKVASRVRGCFVEH